jgi:hypothetical protein
MGTVDIRLQAEENAPAKDYSIRFVPFPSAAPARAAGFRRTAFPVSTAGSEILRRRFSGRVLFSRQ